MGISLGFGVGAEYAHDVGMNQPVASLSWRLVGAPAELTPLELARIYRARQQVFSIEQNCVYLDADEADEHSYPPGRVVERARRCRWPMRGWSTRASSTPSPRSAA